MKPKGGNAIIVVGQFVYTEEFALTAVRINGNIVI